MPHYRIDAREGIVEISGPEAESPEEFEALVRAIVADPAFRSGFGFLRNRRDLPPPQTTRVRRGADYLRHLPALARSRWAFVVADPASYGMIRMGATLAETGGIDGRAFSDEAEARRWLTEGWMSSREQGQGPET